MAGTLTFSDTFNNLSLWNGTSGTWLTNYHYQPLNNNGTSLNPGEQEWYINSNYGPTKSVVPWTVKDGILTITGAKADPSIQPLINGYKYTSGQLDTYHSFSQTYGFFEARMQLPAGDGMWPAFWMIPESGAWPPEIDITEVLGKQPNIDNTSLHSGTPSHEISTGKATTVADTSKAYHEYAVDWTPSTITFYFDNKAVYSAPTPSDMNIPMYMELNLAMGGSWPGNVDSSTPLPAHMRVANVEAYSSNPGTSSNPAANLPTTTFTANNTPGQVIIGKPGNDVFNAGTSSVTMTGQGLTNTYIWNALPTATPHITDFDPATDTINIGGLLKSVGYAGSNPFGDGTISFVSDGHGGTDVKYNHNGASTVIVDLDNIATSEVTGSSFVTTGGTAGGGTGSTGGTGGTSTGGTGGTSTGGTGTGGTSTGGTGSTGTGSTGGTGSDPLLAANNTAGQVLKATSPNTTFMAGQNSVIMTEDGGPNTFVYAALPWNAGQITNFNVASDKIDVSAMLKAAGYTGSNPFGDGTLSFKSDGHGGTDLMYNPPGAGSNGHWPITVVDIDHVAASSLNIANDFITSVTSGSTGSTGGSTGTGTGGTSTGGTGSTGSGTTTGGTGSTDPGSTGTGTTGGTSTGGTGSTGTGTTTAGQTLTANDTAGQHLTATTPNDTFIAGHNSVIMTGDGGSNLYVFDALPWNAGQITNFNPAADKIDVSAILHSVGYQGTNPFGDGTLSFKSDGHGGTDLMYNPPGAGSNGHWPITIVDIDHVTASSLHTSTDFVTGTAQDSTGTSTGGTSTGGTGTGTTTGGSGSTDPGSTGTGSTGGTSTGGTGSGTATGATLTANDTAGQHLTATTPNDTFIAGHNSVIMTEDGGSNTFVFNALPWNAGQITNFNVTSDTMDVRGILHSVNYSGSNPFGDGTLGLKSDGHGGTYLMYNPPGAGTNGHWPITIVDVDHVVAANLNLTKNFILH